MKLNRIRIVGGPGSGKSYAGKKLSEAFKIPHFDLDNIFWHKKDKDYTLKYSEKQRAKKFNAIVKKKQWIIEGTGSTWSGPSFEKADMILVLKNSKFLRAYRILRRSLHARLKITKRKVESIPGLIHFLTWNHNWEKTHEPRFKEILKNHKRKTRYFKSSDDLISYARKHNN